MNFTVHGNIPKSARQFYHYVDFFCEKNIDLMQLEKSEISLDLWKKLGQAELLGLTVDPIYTGKGFGLLEQLISITLISAHSPSLGLSYGAHSNLCVHQLNKYGSHIQKNKYLPKLISGQHIGALAISEVNAGSDALNMQLEAKRINDNYFVLNGSKMWITNGPDANVIIVYAKTDENITAFLIDKSITGWSSGQIIDKIGMRASKTSEIYFNNCYVPVENVIGEINQGLYILMDGLSTERLILTGGAIGIMQACLELMKKYMNTRIQFNKTIGEFQLMRAKIAECYAVFAATSAWAINLCQNENINKFDPTALLMLASESASKVANETVQTFGGNGYTNDYEAAIYFTAAKLYEIGAGTNEIRKNLVGKYILGNKQ